MPTPQEEIEEIKRLREINEIKFLRGQTAKPKADVNPASVPIGENVPIIGPLGRRLGEGFRAGIESLAGDETYGKAYDRIRAENDTVRNQYSDKYPVLDTASKVVGGIGGAPLIPVPGGASFLANAGRIGAAAGGELTDAKLRGVDDDLAEEAAVNAAGIQTSISAVPFVGKIAKPLAGPLAQGAQKVGQALENTAGMRALKHMYGNVDKAWELTPEKDRIPLGITALKTGIVRFGEKVGKSADRAKQVGKDAWNKVEGVFSGMDDLAKSEEGLGRISGEDIAQYIEAANDKIRPLKINEAVKKGLSEEAEQFRGMGSLPPAEAQAIKGEYKFRQLDPKTAQLGKDGTNIVNQGLAKAIKSGAAKSGVKGSEAFDEAYNLSGQAGNLQRFGKIQDKRMTKNRTVSLTDYLAGGAGGAAAAAITGDASDSTAAGLLLATANNLARKRGNSAAAAALYKASGIMKASPEKTAEILAGLRSGAIGGRIGQSIAHQLMIQNQRSEEGP